MKKDTDLTSITPPAAGPAPVDGERRQRYSRPRVTHREQIEAVAADCSFPGGKSDPTCIVGFS